MIETVGLKKVFPGHHGHAPHVAVDDLSFSVTAGSSLGIVGESGAGKSTVAAILLGFELPTAGSITINGQTPPQTRTSAERKRWARQIQMVFQDPYSSLDPRQQVGNAINEILRFHFTLSASDRKTRVERLLDAVGLSRKLADVRPGALSGGQRQRVAIAKAIAVEPEILVLDESVSALDVSIQAQVLNMLNDLRRDSGMTYVLISHDLGVVRYSTDQVVVMREGTVVESGTTSSVLDLPKREYTRALLAAVPRPGWTPTRTTTE